MGRFLSAVKSPNKTIKILKKRYLALGIDSTLRELEKISTEHKLQEGPQGSKVSIILLTFNNLRYSKSCIYSILDFSNYSNLELVIIDNGSSDETPEFLKNLDKDYGNVRVILNKNNRGFAGACNQGIKKATGEYFIFLNNDTIVTPNWIERLVQPLKDKKIGLVGPITNFMWNHQEIDIFYRSLDTMLKKSSQVTGQNKGKTRVARDVAFFCVAARSDVIKEVGDLDERFGMGMFEDDDYCLRVQKAGYKIVVVEDVFVHHFGQISLFSLGRGKYNELLEENREKFEKKWGKGQND